ncbi:unnamed protein product [Vicia faba]|uniref:Reverse transcriptase RNase H-like domain-containing protein n=1 Tax=Vicia faba TaxID=3906 RepID=A0AAV1B7E8_VICFA|nr:unnamed protein product [Vicia faba]
MDGHTSPSMAWRDFPLTVPEVRSFILSFGRSLILERRKGINPDRQHPKRSLSFSQASKVPHSIISYLTFLTVAVTARLLCSATPCFIFEWKRKAIFSYGLRDSEGPSKLDHPTHCLWGRRLSPTERNYTITEREGLTCYILYRSFDISY